MATFIFPLIFLSWGGGGQIGPDSNPIVPMRSQANVLVSAVKKALICRGLVDYCSLMISVMIGMFQSYGMSDTIGCHLDLDNKDIKWSKNGKFGCYVFNTRAGSH